MLYSMTGYGESVYDDERIRVGIRVRTINYKGLDAAVKLPPDCMYLENGLRGVVKKTLYRGRVEVFCEIDLKDEDVQPAMPLNRVRVTQLLDICKALKEEFGVAGEPDINTLLRMPDIAVCERVGFKLPEDLEQKVYETLARSLEELQKSRALEGGKLCTDIQERLAALVVEVDALEKMSEERQDELRDAVRKRLDILKDDVSLDESRLAQEVVYYADRLDISEEITRLRAHLGTIGELLASDKRPLGKELDFMIQEQMREVTTIGNKAKHRWIADRVVKLKTGFEKIREQTQNIE